MALILSTGLKSTAATLVTGSGKLWGVQIIADGTNAANVTITDGSGGTELAKGRIKAASNPESISIPCHGVQFNTGLTLVISGTNAACILVYEKLT